MTQHFFDALGRETNTVVGIAHTPGEASTPASILHSTFSILHSHIGSDYSVSTDERGATTVVATDILQDCVETTETVLTNGVEVMETKTRSFYGGGSSTCRAWGPILNSQFSFFNSSRRFTEYDALGRRVEYAVTESSDCGVVTNSATTYDLLGRVVRIDQPAFSTNSILHSTFSILHSYDGFSSRVLETTTIAENIVRTTGYLYNDFGEQIGTVADGVTNRADVAYEQVSNDWWKATATSVTGPFTNSLTIVREQLTGLCDSCRRHTITLTGGATSPLPTVVTETIVSYDPDTDIETETVTSSVAATVVRRYRHGVLLSTETNGEVTSNAYDAFGRVVARCRGAGGPTAESTAVAAYDYAPCGDLIATHTFTNGTDAVTETYDYDMLGNRVATTDALGGTIYKAYDPFGRVVAEWGVTYPVRHAYDTHGRRTSLSTTRDGAIWDTTTWAYDHATGLCTNKTYADGSTVAYTYTPDNLPLRTTYASGRWNETVYDGQRRRVGVVSSDGAQDASMQRDEFGRVTTESNFVAHAAYSLDDCWGATNETQTVDGFSVSFKREFDAYGRLARFARIGGEESVFGYAPHGAISVVSNGNVAVEYAFTGDAYEAGYALFVQGGADFSREVFRHDYFRSCIVAVSNHCGNALHGLEYSYDALQRPISRNDDSFAYNERGEVVFSRRAAENAEEAYSYDDIGNLLVSSVNATTNTYASNNRNQYTSILRASTPPRETSYDLDGNMTRHGDWTYSYDSGNRLVTVSSNNMLVASFAYDAQGRRVKKVAADGTHRYFYDGWLIVYEHIVRPNNTTNEIEYVWGKDISGTRDGAAGIGGLLYMKRDGAIYVPWYDVYGNILGYHDAQGNLVATYIYDAFGIIVAKSGIMLDAFAFRYSTKYFDPETDLYYYGYRYYKPQIIRWLTEDQIGETGGYNLYLFCLNSPLAAIDALGDVAVTDIPGIMDANKWSVGAALMRHWLSLDAKKPTTPNETIVKMGWVLGFERAKTVYDKIFSEKQYVNQSAKKEIVAMIKRTLKGVDGNFCPLNRPASQVESDYINTRQVGSVFDSPDDLMAALGRFNLRMAVSGYVKGNCAFITRVGVYVRDSYDFVGDQSLGYWNSRTNYAGKNFFKGDKVSNASFRDYAKKTGKGADFIVYSDIKITTLDKAEKVVLSP